MPSINHMRCRTALGAESRCAKDERVEDRWFASIVTLCDYLIVYVISICCIRCIEEGDFKCVLCQTVTMLITWDIASTKAKLFNLLKRVLYAFIGSCSSMPAFVITKSSIRPILEAKAEVIIVILTALSYGRYKDILPVLQSTGSISF